MIAAALLRGINVGGNSIVSMAKLKTTFERLGLAHVQTYINSGNVIFETDRSDIAVLTTEIEAAIVEDFGFPVPILIRDLANLKVVAAAAPSHWQNNTEMKTDVMFLWQAIDKQELVAELGGVDGIDEITYVPGAVLWRVDRPNVNKSKLLKLVGTPTYKQMTVRNINTVRKLVALMKAR